MASVTRDGGLVGRSADISGAASGIGQRRAERFTVEEVPVAMVDVDGQRAESAAATFAEAIPLTADLAVVAEYLGGRSQSVEAFGAPDVLVDNAATCSDTPFDDIPYIEWERDFSVCLLAPYRRAQKRLPALWSGRAVVSNVISVSILSFFGSEPYSAAKAASISLVRSPAVRLARLACGRTPSLQGGS